MPPLAAPGPRPVAQGLNLIWTLVLQNFAPRTRRDSGRIAWVFLEPIGLTAVTAVVFALIGRGTPYGPSLALFLASGIVVLTFFLQGAQAVITAVINVSAPNRLAAIGVFHDALAQIVFKIIVNILYFFFLIYAIGWFDNLASLRLDIVTILTTFLWCGLFTFGWGLLMGYCFHFAPAIAKAYGVATRAMIFVSGVFFVPSFLPPQFRDWLAWNPILHFVERMRFGLYADYPSIVYDSGFVGMAALGAAALGVLLVWFRRARLLG
jgi:capsular polysaccharide transport system permease protein